MSDFDALAEAEVTEFLKKPKGPKKHHADDDLAPSIEQEKKHGPPASAKKPDELPQPEEIR